jgi:sugar phosphate isomerase/epimerase
LRVCRDAGVDAIEMRLGLNAWSDPAMPRLQALALRDQLRDGGVALCALGTGIVVREYDAALLRAMREQILLAATLGATGLRIMLGTYKVRYSDSAPQPDLDGIVRWLRAAAQAAADAGVELWLETHNEFATGAAMRRVLDAVRHPACKILYDVIHPLELGEPVADTLAQIGADLAHVHIKDGRPWADPDLANWEYTPLGQGDIALDDIVARLRRQGYAGYYSLEWESAWRAEIRGPGFEGERVIPAFARYMARLAALDQARPQGAEA